MAKTDSPSASDLEKLDAAASQVRDSLAGILGNPSLGVQAIHLSVQKGFLTEIRLEMLHPYSPANPLNPAESDQ